MWWLWGFGESRWDRHSLGALRQSEVQQLNCNVSNWYPNKMVSETERMIYICRPRGNQMLLSAITSAHRPVLLTSPFGPAVGYNTINQTSIAPISPAKSGSVVRQPNQCWTAKSRKQFHNVNRPSGMPVSMGGKAKSKRCVVRCFWNNWNGWTDRQREVVPKRRGTIMKSSCICVGLDPRDW